MSIAHAPSKLSWVISRLLSKMPYYQSVQTARLYKLAEKAANLDFAVRLLDSGWATQSRLNDEDYRTLTSELLKIDETLGTLCGGVHPSLHWSRRYEYPYALEKCIPAEQSSGRFRILDCGAGPGPIQFYLTMRGHDVYSLELDLRALEQVARCKSKMKLETLYPTYGNVLDLPFPNDYFDRTLSISVLEHTVHHLEQDTEVILKGYVNELLRVTKPKGLIVLTFDVNMNPKSVRRLLYKEYESLCKLLGILPTPPPQDRLYSSDTDEGRLMGKDLCVYCATFEKK